MLSVSAIGRSRHGEGMAEPTSFNGGMHNFFTVFLCPAPVSNLYGATKYRSTYKNLNFSLTSERMKFHLLLYGLRRRLLPIDRARSRERGQPLCMEQYYRLFTSYRYPGVERDSLVTSYTSDDEPEHIIVACKNQVEAYLYYSLPVLLNCCREK